MKVRLMQSLALAAIVALPQGAQAQEPTTPELGPLSSVSTWQIDPADFEKFLAVAEKIVKAAKEANLGADYAWTMWQDLYTVAIVGPFNKAELDDPEVWMKQFMGTPGEATLMEAFQEFEAVSIVRGATEIHQEMPDWSYTPEGMGEPSYAWVHVHEFWLKSGQENLQKWNAVIGDFMTFFKNVGYPYPVWGSRVRYGENRAIFVVAYDDQSEYYGAKSVEALAQEHMAGDRWQELLARLAQLTNRAEDDHYEFLSAQSYVVAYDETGSR